jgi:hypothetical protein
MSTTPGGGAPSRAPIPSGHPRPLRVSPSRNISGRDPFDVTAGRASSEHLSAARADIDRVLAVVGPRLLAIVTAMNGHPPGRGFDAPSGQSSVTFCEVHEKERCECGGGTTYAARSDRTGEQGLLADRAKQDHDRVLALARALRRQAAELVDIVDRYSAREATDVERRETMAANESEHRCCASCARWEVSRGVRKWEPAVSRLALSAGGESTWLCQWCLRWVRAQGSLPSVVQVERHHHGERVRKLA